MISEIFKRSYFGLGEKDVYSYFAIFFVIFIYDPIAALYFSIFDREKRSIAVLEVLKLLRGRFRL